MGELFDGKLLHGAAVYPEVLDAATSEADAAHMRRLGMNTARLGEFTWSALEPDDGGIRLDVLDRALDVLGANGLNAIVCTPTATPPVWLTVGHPERLHHTADGIALGHGSRQHICTNNPVFRDRAARITQAVAAAVGNDRRVLAWQLDNEFKSHVGGCHCATCRDLWTEWLAARYQEVGQLNEAWHSAVLSETYQNFGQVLLPGPTPFLHNTSLLNDFRLFSQELINRFAREQADIIRAHSNLPVTHNSGYGFDLDNAALFADLDFSSFDTFPSASNHSAFLMNLDYFPRLAKSRRTVLMETSPSHGGSVQHYGVPHPHGFVEAEAFANYASGSAGFLFWHFRQHRGGSEQAHGSVLSAWGQPTIGYSRADAIGRLLPAVKPLLDHSSPAQPSVAVHYSDHAEAFLTTEAGDGAGYRGLPMREFYERTPERTHIRIGPDWSALVSNWFSEWERTGDAQWKDRIVKGISQLEAMPHGLLSGPTLESDASALDLHHMFTGTEGGFHMIIAFGAPQVWMEVAEALDHDGFRRMLADFGRFYALPEAEKQRLTGGALDTDLAARRRTSQHLHQLGLPVGPPCSAWN